MKKKNRIYILGHKNPDTDSICSALAYADLKRRLTGEDYIAARAGNLNEETQYIVERFGITPPVFLKDVGTQVRDIEIRETPGVSENISLKKAWTLMKDLNVVTLPITDENNFLTGLINIGDITKSYMEVYDSRILSNAHTKYRNIIETLEAEMLVDDPQTWALLEQIFYRKPCFLMEFFKITKLYENCPTKRWGQFFFSLLNLINTTKMRFSKCFYDSLLYAFMIQFTQKKE